MVPARWSVTQRPATAAELALLQVQDRFPVVDYLYFAALGCPFLGIGFAALRDDSICGTSFGLIMAVFLFAIPIARARPDHRARLAVRSDVQHAMVDMIHVDGATPIQSEGGFDFLVFDLSGGKVLQLTGTLVRDGTMYGLDATAADDLLDESKYNALPEPWAFPTSAFTVHRFPHSRTILRIDIRGPYVEPESLPVPVGIRGDVLDDIFDRSWDWQDIRRRPAR